ncbi:hypothetical protein ACTXT7_016253 [Hymenolepis weldensis]
MIHAKKVMDRCLDFDPKIHAYWFVMAQLTARNEFKGKVDIQPGQLDEFKCLLQAVEECFNLDALWHLVPSVFSLMRVCFGRYYPSSDKDESLQLARFICAEYLNRCLAFYPNDYRLWHDRGLLLQLSGLYRPAYYCFERANGLILKLDSRPDSNLITVRAHYLLSAFQQGKIGISELDAFTKLLIPGSKASSGVHAVVALFHLSIFDFSAAKQALQDIYSACDLNASSAHYLEGLTAAFIRNTAETFSDAAEFIRLTSGLKFNPKSNTLRCAVLEQGLLYNLNPLPLIPLVEGWDAFLDSPTFGYEWLNLMSKKIFTLLITRKHSSTYNEKTSTTAMDPSVLFFQYLLSQILAMNGPLKRRRLPGDNGHLMHYESNIFNSCFALSPTLEQAKQVLALLKTWVYLRPNKEALWTLLATAQRLYAGLQVVRKYREKVKVMESGISCLQSAAAVCQLCPTSEILTKELVNYANDAIVNEQAVFEILKPLILRSAVFFPHVQGLSAALNRLCS